ncbi:MAG TPA: hypothetical protein VJA94_06735 [Candidatus Angelobacter sp.]
MRTPSAISLTILISLLTSLTTGQQSTGQSTVEMQYCGMKVGRPPLKYLNFDVTIRNSANKAQWFIFPAALYDKAVAARENAGIDGIEWFSDSPEHKVTVVEFTGTMKLQPDGAGGFKGILLPAGGAVSIHGLGVSFWGEPVSPLAIRVVIANKITIGNKEVAEWLGKDLLSAKTADVRNLDHAGSKMTEGMKELPMKITKSDEINIPDTLAKRCDK